MSVLCFVTKGTQGKVYVTQGIRADVTQTKLGVVFVRIILGMHTCAEIRCEVKEGVSSKVKVLSFQLLSRLANNNQESHKQLG